MESTQLLFKTDCPVCAAPISHPEDIVCTQCGWLAIVYTDKPTVKQVERLGKLSQVRSRDYSAYAIALDESRQIESRIKVLQPLIQSRQERLAGLEQGVRGLLREKEELAADPVLAFDFEKMKTSVSNLERECRSMRSKLGAGQELKIPAVSIRCTYDAKKNEILAVVTQIRPPGPAPLELHLGLAVSARPFTHYSDADMVIPVKTGKQPVKIRGIGDEFYLELALRLEEPVAYYEIIHLYAQTLTKFIIE